jgi:ribosomal-protein-alanine N-acetyltransferase
MSGFLSSLFARAEPAITEARPQDAASLAGLHAASFRRGWSEEEFERLLADRNVVAHRATIAGRLAGFVLSRVVAGEAEILSVAVAAPRRGRGIAGRLLDLHLRRLAGLGVGTVFLEVDEDNASARRLYRRARFAEAGRREGYYPRPQGAAAALVLRRELT